MYIERLIEKKILRKLRLTGGVLIEGARDIGKTKVSQQICKSEITIKENNIEHIQLDNKIVTSGEKPRLIDEWQIYPQTFNIVKHNIDKEEKNNLFILTGSSTPTK
jgi:predicted AAA+ superfamily ATPase